MNPEVIAAAYLHDVLEDTSVTPEELERTFGGRILSLVQEEVRTRSGPGGTKGQYDRAFKAGFPRGEAATLGDKLSNMLQHGPGYMVIGDEIWQRFNERTGKAIAGIWPEFWMVCRI